MKINNIVVGNTEPANTNDLWLNPEDGFKYFGNSGWTSAGGSAKTIKWTETSKLSDFIEPGIYICENTKRYTLEDELPITNVGEHAGIGFTLIVNSIVNNPSGNPHQLVGQTLILANRIGGETKQYIRSLKYNINNGATPPEVTDNTWTPWKELKGTTNLNQISDAELKNYTENGLYEGVIMNGNDISWIEDAIGKFFADLPMSGGAYPIPSGTLFTMEVLNNYAVVNAATSMGKDLPVSISQKAKCLFINGSYVEVVRKSINGSWSSWYPGNYEVDK